MNEYALYISDEFKEIRNYVEKPVDIPHKNVVWYDVVREYGEPFTGLENGQHVIRTEEPVPPRRMIEKWLIMERLTDEQLSNAMSLMTVRQQEKWRMPGYPSVYVDDPEVLALLQAIGADLEEVLA